MKRREDLISSKSSNNTRQVRQWVQPIKSNRYGIIATAEGDSLTEELKLSWSSAAYPLSYKRNALFWGLTVLTSLNNLPSTLLKVVFGPLHFVLDRPSQKLFLEMHLLL